MRPNILIIDGHPDPALQRLVHAMADAYRQGAEEALHDVRVVRVADLTFPMLRSQSEYEKEPPVDVRQVQHLMDWAVRRMAGDPAQARPGGSIVGVQSLQFVQAESVS
jgi:putative NADPH-quinone reductase